MILIISEESDSSTNDVISWLNYYEVSFLRLNYDVDSNVIDIISGGHESRLQDTVLHIKDAIKICQDCEFRHICTDCRAYLDNPKDLYSHPAKCTYNPYQAKWKNEEGYIPVTEMSLIDIENIKTANA